MSVMAALHIALGIINLGKKTWPLFLKHVWPLRRFIPFPLRQLVKSFLKKLLPPSVRMRLRRSETSIVMASNDGAYKVVATQNEAVLVTPEGKFVKLFLL